MQKHIAAQWLAADSLAALHEEDLDRARADLHALMGDPLARHRHLVTLIAMPSCNRAMQMLIRNETRRRMTITAIALKRCHPKHGRYPASLDALDTEFVSTVSIDPMGGQPFCYGTIADRSFTLYSVGEDGMDDRGNTTATNAVERLDLWSGRDAVWPVGVTTNTQP